MNKHSINNILPIFSDNEMLYLLMSEFYLSKTFRMFSLYCFTVCVCVCVRVCVISQVSVRWLLGGVCGFAESGGCVSRRF